MLKQFTVTVITDANGAEDLSIFHTQNSLDVFSNFTKKKQWTVYQDFYLIIIHHTLSM